MVNSKLASGVLMVAVIILLNGSDGLAMDARRTTVADRIGHGGSIYRSQAVYTASCMGPVEVIERIGAGGSTYSSSRRLMSSEVGRCQVGEEGQQRVSVIQRIGAGGSTYSVSLHSVGEFASR